ncbi:cobalt transporter CbiM [Alcaligenes sp. WGS1538]|uniref:cobalt transporter CbiM n=1 Tax=Alcaligenes sp. WGS1538 TaxID=3366811 RepID=UPI00372D5320
MHLSEGILSAPVVTSSLVLSGALVAATVRRLNERTIPLAAMLGCVFFALGTIHVPVGPGSVHLILNGLLGALLGWTALPVIALALVLQAALFGFGGFAVWGANLLIMGLPAVLAHYLARPWLQTRPLLAGALAAAAGVSGAALVAAVLLYLSGGHLFAKAIATLFVFHLPIVAIEAVVTALCLRGLQQLRPDVFALLRS